jgi:hypothetical protein
MATFKAVILTGGRNEKTDGTTNIKIRVTHLQKINYISTDLYIDPTQLNKKEGVIKSGRNKDFINLRITDLLQKYRNADIQLGDRRDHMTVNDLKYYLLSGKSNSSQIDFFEFSQKFSRSVKVKGTAQQYEFLVASLKSFVGPILPISEINLSFISRYESYLRSRGVENGIVNYMTTFRSLFNKARSEYNDEDSGTILIPHYPFRKYSIPKRKVKSNDHVLTIQELQMFMSHKPENPGEKFAADMFMLMFYLIGIEAKDLFYLNAPSNGRIFYDRYKTGRPYSVKLEPEAISIIEQYKGNTRLLNLSDTFMHHKSFYRKINNYIKGEKAHNIHGILQKIGISKPVTTKWAKHAWATIARNECRINKADLALCLGHEDADNRVTNIYVKYDYSIIDEANRKVLDMVRL